MKSFSVNLVSANEKRFSDPKQLYPSGSVKQKTVARQRLLEARTRTAAVESLTAKVAESKVCLGSRDCCSI